MKQCITLTILFFMISCRRAPHSYDFYIAKMDSCYFCKNYETAGLFADSAFSVNKGSRSDYYNAACCWALAADQKKAFRYLNKAIDKGYLNIKWLTADKDLASLHNSVQWNKLIERMKSRIDAYEAHFNKPLKHELEEIFDRDQMCRNPKIMDSLKANFGNDSEEMDLYWKRMAEIDSINLQRVVEIIDSFGWLGTSLVGESANKAVWIVIQHADVKIQEKYLPLLQESVQKHESSAIDLAYLKDRILMYNNKPQLYGTQFIRDSITNEWFFAEIQDPKNVNKRRKEIGLETIEDYAKISGVEYKHPDE